MNAAKIPNLFQCPSCLWAGIDNREIPARQRRCPKCWTQIVPVNKRRQRIDRKARVFSIEGCSHTWDGTELKMSLPWPPSNNVYYRHARGVTYISADGRAFKAAVWRVLQGVHSFGEARVRMTVTMIGPTHQRRDIKNFDKALCDVLNRDDKARFRGVYDDDEQIDDFRVLRGPVRPGGQVQVVLTEIAPAVVAPELF